MEKGHEVAAGKSNNCTVQVHPFDDSSNKRYNELFRPPESLLLSILANLPDPIFVKDAHHHWVFINKKFCELIGLPEEKILGKSDYDFFTKEQADGFWTTDDLVFADGIVRELTEFITDSHGNTRTIATKKTLLIDEKGSKFLVGTIRDITELSLLRNRELQVNKVLKKLALGGALEEVLSDRKSVV